MALKQDKSVLSKLQEYHLDDPDFLQGIVLNVLQHFIDSEMEDHLSAGSYERTDDRKGYRNGSYPRTLKTRVGRIELQVPRDREGNFRTAIFERYQRNEKALVLSLMEMHLMGVSTRKVKKITEQLCGTSFSASMISSLSENLDAEIETWRNRQIEGECPYIFVDALYEKVRYDGKVVSMAVCIVVGVNEQGYRSILAVEVSHSENEADYADLFKKLIDRGLKGVQLVISDDHKGIKKAVESHFIGSSWQRCQVHFMRNFLSKLRRKDRTWAMTMLKDVFNAPDKQQAESRLKLLVDKLSETDQDLADWLEENAPEAMTVFNFPEQHRRRIKSTNCLERLNEEIRRRTRVIRIFPHRQSCLRLISALCQEKDEEWTTGKMYLNMTLLEKNKDKQDKNIRIAG